MKRSKIKKQVRKAVKRSVRAEIKAIKTRTLDQLTDRLERVISSNEPLDMDEKVSNLIPGGPNALQAFVGHLNKRGPFIQDGVILKPNAFVKAKEVWDLLAAIRKAYRKAGWRVVSS